MPVIQEYKCPACGGAMEFDSATQKLKCPYCDTVIAIEDYPQEQDAQPERTQKQEEKQNGSAGEQLWERMSAQEWKEEEGMRLYTCNSCGGEIIADAATGATSCPFCGNQVVIESKFSGDLRPDYIIPFKKSKKDLKAAYKKHLEGKRFMPPAFKLENHLDEFQGIYVPFWLFDAEVDAAVDYHAERVRHWSDRKYDYTETRHYEVQRAGDIRFSRVPADCSKKLDDTLMESIEPYHSDQAVPFQPAYLAGYAADRYDVLSEECIGRATNRMKASAEMQMANTVKGYHVVLPINTQMDVRKSRYWYALYPVWLLNTSWKGQKYTFAMNGETGRLVGDLPFDSGAFLRYILLWGLAWSGVLYLLFWILMMLWGWL